MDKRFLLFFVLVTASFFLIQNYFTPPKETVPQKQIVENEEKSLPFTPLFPDVQKKETPRYGIAFGEQFFVLGNNLPETLYHKEKKLEQLALSDKGIAIYGNQKKFLFVPTPPEKKEIQLISLNEKGLIDLASATLEAKKVSNISQKTGFSLCFYRQDDNFYPLGFYDPEKEVLSYIDETPPFGNLFQKVAIPSRDISSQANYYVLENDYQQLVFSNIGGSLSEINLPFAPPSVVKKIEYDRVMKNRYPQNAHFPQFSTRSAKGEIKGTIGGYYPLLRRDIFSKKDQVKDSISPRYYALNIVGDDVEHLPYSMNKIDENTIQFTLSQPHRRITKTYYFPQKDAPYIFYVKILVEGDARDLWLSTGVPEVELISGSFNPTLKYNIEKKGKTSVEKIKLPKPSILSTNIAPNWICNSNGFFGIILDPLNKILPGYKAIKVPGEEVPTKLSVIDAQYQKYPASKYPGYEMLLPLKSNQPMEFRIFAGPFEDDVLQLIDKTYSDPTTGYNPDYHSAQSFHGFFSFISAPFAKFMFFIMKIFHKITGSWALSILFITVILRLMLYPLNAWSIKSQAKTQKIQPKLKALQQKYKKDPKKMQMETMKLYRESGVNPFMGCFPILIQMPFLLGMFDLLKSTFELRGATFIPGWIDSLTAPDVLFSWSYPIFFIGTEFHLLPILLGGVMFVQQRYTLKASGADMNNLNDQQRQQVTTGNIMVIVFTLLFYNFPSGLNLYWLFSMVLGILQQYIMKGKMAAAKTKTTT